VPSLPFRSLLQQQTFPISLTDDQLTVGCMSETHQTTIKKPEKFIHLQKAVDKIFGRPIRIEVVLEKRRPSTSSASIAPTAPLQPVMEAVTSNILAEKAHVASSSTMTAEPRIEAVSTSHSTVSSAVAVAELSVATAIESPSVGFSQSVTATSTLEPPLDLDVPPLVDDEGPMMDEEEAGSSTSRLSIGADNPGESPSAAVVVLGGDPALHEAKKNVMEVLHGRMLD